MKAKWLRAASLPFWENGSEERMTSPLVVNISGCQVSANVTAQIQTYALGSCIGVAIYDPLLHIGGMAHVMLPVNRSLDAENNPFLYADTGTIELAQQVVRLGGHKDGLVAKIAGGANMLVTSPLLDVGKKNAEVVLSTLALLKIPLLGSSLGGSVGRSFYLNLSDGKAVVRYIGAGEEIL